MGIKDNEKLAKRVRSASFLVAVGMVVGSLAGFLFTPPHQNDGGMTSQNLYHDHLAFKLAPDDELRIFWFFVTRAR